MQLTPEVLELNLDLEESEQASRTYKIDFERNRITSITDGKDALKQSIYCTLNTERYENLIYSWNYGVELKSLIGKDKEFVVGDLKRRIEDALLIDKRIVAIDNWKIDMNGAKLTVSFSIKSIYGEIPIIQEVAI